jgi:tRNA pseudouridine13 synthase
MQKANRDTQDCLGHLSRVLHVQDKALSTAGTKDKRGVTVQRVCLKRGGMRMSDVWRAVNGVRDKRRSFHQATHDRGERGLRIGDLAYSDEYLELGMLKGNHFTITLR